MPAVPPVPCVFAMAGPDFSIAINAVPPVPAVPPRNRHSAGSVVIIAHPQNCPLHRVGPRALFDGRRRQPLLQVIAVARREQPGLEQMPSRAGGVGAGVDFLPRVGGDVEPIWTCPGLVPVF
jgi:hypothetical protein